MMLTSQDKIRRAAEDFCRQKGHGSLSLLGREAGITRQTVSRFIGGETAEESTAQAVREALRRLGYEATEAVIDPPNQAECRSRLELIGDGMIAVGSALGSDEFTLDEKTSQLEFFIKHTAAGLGFRIVED